MPLSNLAIQNARPRAKPYKLTDGDGVYLLVQPNGSRLWRLNYRFGGRQKTLALGALGSVSAAEAREAAAEARRLLRQGEDPSVARRRRKAEARVSSVNTFGAVAAAYKAKRIAEGVGAAAVLKDHYGLIDAIADYGRLPIKDVRPRDCLASLRRIENRDVDARRVRAIVSRVFRYAIAEDLIEVDPAASLGDALLSRPVTHHASPKNPAAIGALVRAIGGYDGQPLTRLAMLIGVHVFVRPRELRHADKREIMR